MTTDEVRGEVARYAYDVKGRLTKKTVTDEADFTQKISQEEFQYDDFNRLTSDTCTYDTAASQTVQSTIAYVPESENPFHEARVSSCTYKVNGTQKAHTVNSFDDFNRVHEKKSTFTYSPFVKTIHYDNTRVSSLADTFLNKNLGTNTYTYDSRGRILTDNYSAQNVTGQYKRYAYDQYGQLVREDNEVLDKTYIYKYNEIGNMASVKAYDYTLDETPSGTPAITAFGYTADKLTSFGGATIAYNAIGCPTTYEGKTATWTNGRLARLFKGSLAAGSESYTYTYNGFGQRIARNYAKMAGTSADSPLVSGELTASSKQYYYDHAGRLIAESGSKTFRNEGTTTEKIVYLYDESSIIGMEHTINGVASLYYFQRNLQGDVVGIYNTSRTLVAKYLYDAWGNCTISSDTTNRTVANANPIRYRGYYYDDDTGLYYCNARYYSPKWRRFISPDDTAYLDPESANGLNLYSYCNNDPVNYCDPSGHSALLAASIIGFAVGAVLGGIYGGLTAVANDQNVIAGIFIGAFAGGIMGAGAGVASLYLAPALVGQTAFAVGGITYSAGTAVAVGSSIAFASGAAGGMFADAAAQIVNDGGIHDLTSVMISGVQWGVINAIGAYLGSFMGPVSNLESGLLSAIFGSVTSAVGMTVDILRNRRSQKKKVGLYNRYYAYAF